jgi:hypothetical protein
MYYIVERSSFGVLSRKMNLPNAYYLAKRWFCFWKFLKEAVAAASIYPLQWSFMSYRRYL